MKVMVTWQRNFTGELEIEPDKLQEVFGTADPAVLGDYLAKHPIELVSLQAHGAMKVEEQPMSVQVHPVPDS